ncbi:CidA/LrgA family protein [Noviherbaspirillum autotrophicum]|uniref:Murein hydrolase transporter LrgA n=1 Tax=Noviherbaspirillum autotrophicum TaxID=709839 RepID=A0A0C1Y3F5_9BURK|nr:CidA/LrgA family protein [Noviherbaspirillum autotrophicum]KIF81638.1 hypothetical protein TSA66_13905 [Noviherbaspirillum autotrophicum]KIF81999.1 hypothetical protein TSA66_16240 [Noviherbaspirillum autotrophicum]KIF84115.1 hypothetical protein TSA66_00795 [Noviherbaspirillum autotrophicum]
MMNSVIKILMFQALGEAVAYELSLPIPGAVIGMLFLFFYLLARDTEDKSLLTFSTRFLGYMTLLFVPAAVGIMLHMERIANEWLPITVALTTSTVASIAITAFVVRRLRK